MGLPGFRIRNHSVPAHRTRCVLHQPGPQARGVKDVPAYRRGILGGKELFGAADAIACLELHQANGALWFEFEELWFVLRFVVGLCAVVGRFLTARRPRVMLLLLLLGVFWWVLVPTTFRQPSPKFSIGKNGQGIFDLPPSVVLAFPRSPALVANFIAVLSAGLVPGGTKLKESDGPVAQLDPHDAHSNRRPQPERTSARIVEVVIGGQEVAPRCFLEHSGGRSRHPQRHGGSFLGT